MGHDRTNNNAAAIAVILIAGLFFVVIAGGAMMLGGWFFYSSAPTQTVLIQGPSNIAPAPMASPVNVNVDGQIEIDDATISLDELRSHLEELTESRENNLPQLMIHAECPNEIRQPVIDLFMEVTGEQPMVMEYSSRGSDL